jgi:hypothetical protein
MLENRPFPWFPGGSGAAAGPRNPGGVPLDGGGWGAPRRGGGGRGGDRPEPGGGSRRRSLGNLEGAFRRDRLVPASVGSGVGELPHVRGRLDHEVEDRRDPVVTWGRGPNQSFRSRSKRSDSSGPRRRRWPRPPKSMRAPAAPGAPRRAPPAARSAGPAETPSPPRQDVLEGGRAPVPDREGQVPWRFRDGLPPGALSRGRGPVAVAARPPDGARARRSRGPRWRARTG